MRLSVLNPAEMAAHLDDRLRLHDIAAAHGRKRLPLETLMRAVALRDRLRTAAALPGGGAIALDDADLDVVGALVESPALAGVL